MASGFDFSSLGSQGGGGGGAAGGPVSSSANASVLFPSQAAGMGETSPMIIAAVLGALVLLALLLTRK